jgi:hypothetical protein
MEMTLALVQHTHVITSHAYKLHEKKTIACKKAPGFRPGGTRNANERSNPRRSLFLMTHRTKEADATLPIHPVPLRYWETCDALQGGIIVTIDERRLRIQSTVDMGVGENLHIMIFFSLGQGFEGIKVSTKIVGKDLCSEGGPEQFEYEVEFTGMSEEDHLRLRNHLQIRQSTEKTCIG